MSVPVLSTTRVSTLRRTSIASAFLKSTPIVAPLPVADHDRHRRGEPESARAGDDQDRDRIDQRVRQARLRARRAAQTANVMIAISDDDRNEVSGDDVGQLLNRRAAALRLADHRDDAREQSLRADSSPLASRSRRCR